MKFIIDRFEGNYAICERTPNRIVNILRKNIPEDAKEGDVLIRKFGSYLIDEDETQNRKDEIEKLMNDVFEE